MKTINVLLSGSNLTVTNDQGEILYEFDNIINEKSLNEAHAIIEKAYPKKEYRVDFTHEPDVKQVLKDAKEPKVIRVATDIKNKAKDMAEAIAKRKPKLTFFKSYYNTKRKDVIGYLDAVALDTVGIDKMTEQDLKTCRKLSLGYIAANALTSGYVAFKYSSGVFTAIVLSVGTSIVIDEVSKKPKRFVYRKVLEASNEVVTKK